MHPDDDGERSLLETIEMAATLPDDEMERILRDTTEKHQRIFLCSMLEWAQVGRPRYVLGESVAAMLIATRPAPLAAESLRTPYPSILIELPGSFSPWVGAAPLQILVGTFRDDRGMYMDITARQRHGGEAGSLLLADDGETVREQLFDNSPASGALPIPLARLVLNLIWYLTAHRECVELERAPARPGSRPRSMIHRVGLPREIVVTREFRQQAQRLAKATSLRDVRGVVRHIVCGHWKRPPHGDGSRLIWIAPYARGELALGRVVVRNISVSKVSGH